MDKRVMQAIIEMRQNLALLEKQLGEKRKGAYTICPDGHKIDDRSVLQDQILELRQRLKEELERQKDEM